MDLDTTFALFDQEVIAESVAGETLIINLNSGVYYSSGGVGDEIWRYLRDGRSVGQVIDTICARYAGDVDTIRAEVIAFISRLADEHLVVPADTVAIDTAPPASSSDDAPAYRTPVLESYTDYQELLLLDPIHDVLETSGWPVLKPDTTR